MYRDRWRDPEDLERERQERRREEARKKQFEAEHCMYSSGEEIGPPGCCLAPKLFGRACSKHITFSVDEVYAIGQRLLGMTGMRPSAAKDVVDAMIAAVLHEGT